MRSRSGRPVLLAGESLLPTRHGAATASGTGVYLAGDARRRHGAGGRRIGRPAERRRLGDRPDADEPAVNHYRVDAGERVAGLHAHADREELFVVLETPEGRIAADAGQAVRVPPGEFQSCVADDGATALVLGAPRDSEDVRIPVRCPDCDHGEHRLTFPDGEQRPVRPDCGGDRRVVLDADGRAVERCRECVTTTPAR